MLTFEQVNNSWAVTDCQCVIPSHISGKREEIKTVSVLTRLSHLLALEKVSFEESVKFLFRKPEIHWDIHFVLSLLMQMAIRCNINTCS